MITDEKNFVTAFSADIVTDMQPVGTGNVRVKSVNEKSATENKLY
ncbi:Uncharacterised protein [Grimontia hollisae]|uniref:Uncharacterized protein n=1 Tax=Grimontia hollisae TaxID=673 RepID=A0A377HKN0_GRIHO|nr:Uncharacterised protein [Grimontia hollisae]STO56315.1 Uncharacterised protein [Grimontia hollisae]STQ77637.1 Uncharacterised protein [Grimontia hollisae]